MGLIYRFGLGVSKDYKLAMDYFLLSNTPLSNCHIAFMFF
jgi:TPR repeat protein